MKQILVDESDKTTEIVELLREYDLYAEEHCSSENVFFVLDEESSAVVDVLNQSGIKWQWTDDAEDEEYFEELDNGLEDEFEE